MSKWVLFLVFSFSLFVISVHLTPMELGDIWWHLATGRWIFENSAFPAEDPFSLSGFVGKGVLASNWLSQLFLYGVYSIGGVYGLIVLKAVLFLSVFLVLFLTLRGFGLSAPLSYLILIPIVFISLHYSEIRPQTLSFLFFALTLYILEGKKNRYPLLVLVPLWANIHPGFVSGAALISAYIISDLINEDYKGFLLGAASIALSLINPNGFKPYLMATSMVRGSAGGRVLIHEHLPLKKFIELTGEVELYGLIIGVLTLGIIGFLIPIIKRKKPVILHIVIFSFLGYLSFITFRAGLFFGIFGAVSFGRNISDIKFKKGLIIEITAIILSGIFAVYFFKGTIIKRPPVNERLIPVKTADFILKEAPPGGVFAPYEWGGYLIWRLYPRHKVFIDGRALGSIEQYDIVRDARAGWQEILKKNNINIVAFWPILPYEGLAPGIVIALLRDDSWSPIYWDLSSIVFVRGERKGIDKNALWELINTLKKK